MNLHHFVLFVFQFDCFFFFFAAIFIEFESGTSDQEKKFHFHVP